jgi:hypothetical protein
MLIIIDTVMENKKIAKRREGARHKEYATNS